MALVSKSKAAKLAGVSRTTIHRYTKDGKLSMTGDQVDTSELIRVFGKISEQAATPVQTDQLTHHVTTSEQALLQDKVGLLESQIADLKNDRDQWRIKTSELAELLKGEQENTRLLTHQKSDQAQEKGSAIGNLIGTAAGILLGVSIVIAALFFLITVLSE